MIEPTTDSADEAMRRSTDQFRQDFDRLRTEVGRRIVGQQPIVDGVLTSLIAGGHVLLEGVPGLGKTLLVRTLAEVLDAGFSRIQFTPDLMPADLIGTEVMRSVDGQSTFEFQRGPLFADIVLADEINRATPKTQSALLEAMQEHRITVAGVSHDLGELFFVMATQNPLEMEGTYPLPEAQLDRFLMKLIVPFPTASEMETIMDRTTGQNDDRPDKIIDIDRLLQMRDLSRQIPIADSIRRYAIDIVMATHPRGEGAPASVRQFVRYGSSPRGAQGLIRCAKIIAILDGRYHVARQDIQSVARSVLRHRVMLNFEGQAEGVQAETVIDDILKAFDSSAVKQPALA